MKLNQQVSPPTPTHPVSHWHQQTPENHKPIEIYVSFSQQIVNINNNERRVEEVIQNDYPTVYVCWSEGRYTIAGAQSIFTIGHFGRFNFVHVLSLRSINIYLHFLSLTGYSTLCLDISLFSTQFFFFYSSTTIFTRVLTAPYTCVVAMIVYWKGGCVIEN